MNEELEQLKLRIEKIEDRNKKVESDKAWEISWTRKIAICIITYIAALTFMATINTKNVFLGALVPVIGFYLSTQSLMVIKKVWLSKTEREA